MKDAAIMVEDVPNNHKCFVCIFEPLPRPGTRSCALALCSKVSPRFSLDHKIFVLSRAVVAELSWCFVGAGQQTSLDSPDHLSMCSNFWSYFWNTSLTASRELLAAVHNIGELCCGWTCDCHTRMMTKKK